MKLVSIREVSEFLNVKEPTLYSWVHNGTIPSYKLNGLLRFDMEEIREWVRGTRQVSSNVRTPKPKNLDIDSTVKKAIEGVKGKGIIQRTGNQAKIKVSGRRVRWDCIREARSGG